MCVCARAHACVCVLWQFRNEPLEFLPNQVTFRLSKYVWMCPSDSMCRCVHLLLVSRATLHGHLSLAKYFSLIVFLVTFYQVLVVVTSGTVLCNFVIQLQAKICLETLCLFLSLSLSVSLSLSLSLCLSLSLSLSLSVKHGAIHCLINDNPVHHKEASGHNSFQLVIVQPVHIITLRLLGPTKSLMLFILSLSISV